MIHEVALRLQVVGAFHIDAEAATEEGEDFFLHHCNERAIAIDLVGGAPGEELLPDERHFATGHVEEGELGTEAKGFAIDEEDVLARLVADGEVVAEGEEFLIHQVTHGRRLTVDRAENTEKRF